MSLDSLVTAAAGNDLKFVFVGGKGGVGKTTSSSAIATLLASLCHKRVLLISTDPAHSLGDAWRAEFSTQPMKMNIGFGGGGTLDIMEVDPQESMQGELNEWAHVSHEVFGQNDKKNEWESKITQFQEWLSGIPGIDEATALSSAIQHIESGAYDIIVFDTAPTGHTLKLLALPEILEHGLNKLQSWQTTFWGYWEMLKGQQNRVALKEQVQNKLMHYKRDIQKVACMLQDQQRTRFVVVCIAEFLSVSETQRLLQELQKYQVVASHIVVNQLVVNDALSHSELAELESLAEVGTLHLSQTLLQKTVHACRLATARKSIQQRYLSELKGYPETKHIVDGICEVPLLPEEVTGSEAIQRFSKLLIHKSQVATTPLAASAAAAGKLYEDNLSKKNATFSPGDTVQITGLRKAPQFNNLEGKVSSRKNDGTGRYSITVKYNGVDNILDLQPKNIELVQKSEKKAKTSTHNDDSQSSNPIMDKAKALLEDPEIKAVVDQNPKFKDAVQQCLTNPINVMQYLMDPEMAPLISKVMAKM